MYALFIFSLIFSIYWMIYQFKNPDKTQTRIFLDLITGEMFQ